MIYNFKETSMNTPNLSLMRITCKLSTVHKIAVYHALSILSCVWMLLHTSKRLSVPELVMCNAEQELLMHCMLPALAEVHRKQDQYYWAVYLSAVHAGPHSGLPLETLNPTISNTLLLLLSSQPPQNRAPYLADDTELQGEKSLPIILCFKLLQVLCLCL